MRLLILLLLAPLLAAAGDAEPNRDQRNIEAERKKASEKIGPRSVERASANRMGQKLDAESNSNERMNDS